MSRRGAEIYGRRCVVCKRGLKKNMTIIGVPLDEWDNSWFEVCSVEHAVTGIEQYRKLEKYPDWEKLRRHHPEVVEAYEAKHGKVGI